MPPVRLAPTAANHVHAEQMIMKGRMFVPATVRAATLQVVETSGEPWVDIAVGLGENQIQQVLWGFLLLFVLSYECHEIILGRCIAHIWRRKGGCYDAPDNQDRYE
jgi:hypothetical protein